MKRYRLSILTLCMLLGALLLTACMNEVLPLEQEAGTSATASMPDSSYINLHIVNASKPATRATEAATAAENAIYDGILCIFEGASEATCTLKTATVIDQLISNPGTAGTSVDIQVTQRLATGTHAYNNYMYAMALLNTTTTGLYAKDGKLYKRVASGSDTDLSGYTLSALQALKLDSVGSTDEHVGLYMANKNGTLPQVTSPYLFDTPEQAEAGSATRLTIEVERAAARVKVTNDIPAAKPLSSITLVGATTTHPLIHKMTWALNKYNSGAFAVGGGSTNTGIPDNAIVPKDFTYFQQHSLLSGDEVYIGPNNNTDADNTTDEDDKTEVIVEVQLKDGSFLLGDCFSFSWDNSKLYTNVETLTQYFKDNWNNFFGLSQTADEVFRNTKVTVDANGTVTVKLTNSTFSADDQVKLNELAATLSNLTTCHRDGKMYYTYTLGDIERNNAYNLSLVEEGATDTRQVAVTFKFDQGTSGQTATFSNGTASLFTSSSVTKGSNLNYYGRDTDFEQTKFNPTTQHDFPYDTDNIDFLFDPVDGWTFTPSRVSFNTTRFGTDGGKIDIYWLNHGGATTELATGIVPYRNSKTPSILSWSANVTASSVGDGVCGLRLKLYGLKNDKQVGFSDIVIQGQLTKTESIVDPKKSIGGVGRAKP